MNDNLFSYFRTRFAPFPDKIFLEEPGGVRLSYRALVDRTGQIANLLQALGAKPGDRVAVHLEKSVEGLLIYLGALRAGCVYLPLNPAYTLSEVAYFVEDAAPTLLICRPHQEAEMAALAAQHDVAHLLTLGEAGEGSFTAAADAQPIAFDDVARARDDLAASARDDLAAILYTSGTTGRSKGAMLTHDNLRSNCDALREYWRFGADDCLLHALPIFHTHGLFVATNLVLSSGASMIFLPKFDVRQLIAHLPAVTVLMGVPTFYSRLLGEADFTAGLAAHMRLFVSGSAPLSTDTFKAFETLTGKRILERYGMTETNMNTSNPYDGDRVAGSVGFPLPGIEVRITDEQGAVLASPTIGMIEVRGPNVCKGYWNKPDKTAEDFRSDGFFITGDLGYVDGAGYVFIVGRAKDLIISGGLNIYPAEVEQVIDELDGVAESAVIGLPHGDMGEAVVAVVKCAGAPPLSETAILDALGDKLARFKQPRRIVFVDELPRNGMGKIQKKALRETYAALFT
jgi:malonyl-CoA/methylmalonyl-CoA synthetase